MLLICLYYHVNVICSKLDTNIMTVICSELDTFTPITSHPYMSSCMYDWDLNFQFKCLEEFILWQGGRRGARQERSEQLCAIARVKFSY